MVNYCVKVLYVLLSYSLAAFIPLMNQDTVKPITLKDYNHFNLPFGWLQEVSTEVAPMTKARRLCWVVERDSEQSVSASVMLILQVSTRSQSEKKGPPAPTRQTSTAASVSKGKVASAASLVP